ncbi:MULTISPECIES: SDR family oxidoreductase [unclassified Haladaptatus]|uniref:SDR family oxidoreductase n=1 Tax=unclassified Haladaptatus TaxID=2622732 RepID=UPI0023E87947|nr:MULTISPECIES: SDR family oxidoreductase [unclassified Haladaptatus]
MNGIEGKVAIVTGASSGIGRATAERFAAEGAKVIVADVVEDGGRETIERITDAGGDATFVRVDVTSDEDVKTMVETALDTYGGLDFAHNNAGIEGEMAPLADTADDDWSRVIDVNLGGVWRCMKHEIPVMVDRGGGSIVNTSSVAGLMAAGGAPYVASKHGVIGLTRVAAVEYAKQGIRVNAVCPGVVDTPMVQRAGEETPEQIEQFVAMQPLGRMAEPEEIASAVVYLCSDDASFITAHPLPVDGGLMSI